MKYTSKQYAKVLFDLTKEAVDQNETDKIVKNFASILQKNQASRLFSEISRHFKELSLEMNNQVAVDVAGGVKGMDLPKNLGGKTVLLQEKNLEGEGGVSIKVNDLLVDNTIARRVFRLRKALG